MNNNERLELARDWYNDQSTTNKEKLLLENLFPELAESEDERIRKELIELIGCMHNADTRKGRWLACIETGWTGNGKSHLVYWLKSIKERIKRE